MKFAKEKALLALIFIGSIALAGSAWGAQISWSNDSGGNWSNSSNWTGGVVPGAGDTADISLDGTYTVILDGDTTVAGLILGGGTGTQTLSGSSKRLTVNGDFAVQLNGVLSTTSSTLEGSGIISNNGTINLTATSISNDIDNSGLIAIQGNCQFSGALTTQVGSTIRLTYVSNWGSKLTVDKGFTNNGLIELLSTYYQTSSIITASNGPLINSPTGTITANSPAGGQWIFAELDNQGMIEISRPLVIDSLDANHTNSGTINITGGYLRVDQSGTTPSFTNTGIMTIDNGVVLDVNGGAFNYNSGSISGTGTLDFSSTAVSFVPKVAWDGLLVISGGSLTMSDSLEIIHPVTFTNSSIDGAGSILVSDTLNLTATSIANDIDVTGLLTIQGTCQLSGSLTTHASTTLLLTYTSNWGSNLTVDNGFTNNGLIELLSTYFQTSSIITASNGPLINSPTGTITANSPAGGQWIFAELDNQGMIEIGWPLVIDSLDANHTNSGTINITGGYLRVDQSGTTPSFTNTGMMTIDNGVVLDVNGGAFNYNSGSISGTGTLDFSSTAVSFVPKVAWDGLLVISGGSLTISDSLEIMRLSTITSSTADGTGSILVTDTLSLTATSISNDIDNSGLITIQGNCQFSGALTTQVGSTIRLTYVSNWGSKLTVDNGFTNNGLIELLSTYYQTSSIITTSNGPLINSPTGTITANSPAGGQWIFAELDNQGMIEIGKPLVIDSLDANHTNSGTITIDNGYTLDYNGGTFDNQATGILKGNGTIDLAGLVTGFTNAGTINPGMSPGALTITGKDLTQESTSLINIEIESTAGAGFDSLAVSANVTKAGILNVDLYNGYFPLLGDSIPFLSAASVSGDFDSLDLQIGGIIFDTVSSANSVSLVCIQADNYDPTITLDSEITFDVVDSTQMDLWAAADDPEYPDSLLSFSFSANNDSLTTSYDPSTGIVILAGDPAYWGVVELIVTVTDPKGAFAADTITVNVNNAEDVNDDGEEALPGKYVLEQNYPNPFNPSTMISFTIPKMSHVSIEIYNIVGQKVVTLSDQTMLAGSHRIRWDGTDQNGQQVVTGIYFYRLEAGNFVQTKKMVLLK